MAKKPSYRLQPVLEQREREKDAANRLVLQRQKELRFEEQKLTKLQEMRRQVDVRKEECTAKFYEIMTRPGVSIAEESLRHDRFQEVLDKEAAAHDQAIVQQRRAIQRAEQRIEEAKQALLKTAIDVQGMEKHKEQWAHGVKVEEQRKEQAEQEELGGVMWLQQRRERQR
ncbi:hypothetical protein ACFL59_00735 [Planctomycetota bacterium]